MNEYEVKQSLTLIWKNLWLICLITILATIIAGVLSFYVITPEYQTFTSLMIGKPNNTNENIDFSDVMLNKELANTYVEIVKSKAVTNSVINNLNLNISYGQLIQKVNVTILNKTGIIKITVNDIDPHNAVKIATEYANVLIDHSSEIINLKSIQILDDAEIPSRPISPRPLLNMTLTFVISVLMTVLLIFVYDYLRVIKNINQDDTSEIHIKDNVIPVAYDMEEIDFNDSTDIIDNINNTLSVNYNKSKKGEIYSFSDPINYFNLSAFDLAEKLSKKSKILMIDCNTKNPYLHKIFNIYIEDSEIIEEYFGFINKINYTNNNNIDVLIPGAYNIMPNIITKEAIKLLVDHFLYQYDIIILTSTPKEIGFV